MRTRALCCLSLGLLFSTTFLFSEEKTTKRALIPEKHFAILDKYCLECHDSLTEKGGIDLEALDFELSTVAAAETWQKVLNTINSGEMPPEKKEQLTYEEKSAFLEDLSRELVVARELLSDTGGVITMRRLNRREYENTVEDLLGVTVDASSLPDDANSGGFDTTGSALFFSSDQFEQYLALAHKALESAIVFGSQPKKRKLHQESEDRLNKFYTRISNKIKTDYDRAQEWRATKGKKKPSEFDFIDENDIRFHERLYNQQYRTYRQYLDNPLAGDGVLLHKLFNGAVLDTITIPGNWPAGEYRIQVKAAALPGAKSHQQFLEYGATGNGARGGELHLLGCVRISGDLKSPEIITVPIQVTEEGPRTFGFRQRQHNNRDATRAAFLKHHAKHKVGPPPALWIDSLTVEGPFHEDWPPQGTREILFKGAGKQQKDPDAYAREIIKRFAKKAFRIREPSESFLERLFSLYQNEKRAGKEFHEAIREPLAVIMASPGFLYLIEPTPGGPKRELNDREMAVRLSYFLWSSPPDAKLYAAADAGNLKDPDKLAHQVNRMLDDPRSREFIASFAHQWLHMERLDFFQFDHRQFPEFDDSTKEAARREVYETIRSIILDSRPVSDLLSADYAVLNNLLADYYGIRGVEGSEFRKVTLPADSPRGGLLGMAAIHAMGSDGNHASIVERGAWVMRKLLNDAPPPAPPNVPQLSRVSGQLLSPREELSAHMEEAQCATCHARIDPVGYGLHNFDAAGKWREELTLKKVANRKVTKQKVIPIDASGKLPDGTAFSNFYEMRELVAEEEVAFAQGFAEALIEYALGRPYGFSDEALREQILNYANTKNGEMREIVTALIQSNAFRTKK